MPRGDRTGPQGMGPLTGRGAGYCMGFEVPGHMNPGTSPATGYGQQRGRGFGRGMGMRMGMGRGGGRGWRNMHYATGQPGWAGGQFAGPGPMANEPVEAQFTGKQERAYLKAQARQLKDQLEQIETRLAALDAGSREGKE